MTDLGAFTFGGGFWLILAAFLLSCVALMAFALCRAAALGDEEELKRALCPPEWTVDEDELAWVEWPGERAA